MLSLKAGKYTGEDNIPSELVKNGGEATTTKDTTNPEVYKQAFWEITSRHPNFVHRFTDGSKVDEKVAAAAVSSVARNSPFSCRLRDHFSFYTAELQAILFAFKQASQCQQREFMIFSNYKRSEN